MVRAEPIVSSSISYAEGQTDLAEEFGIPAQTSITEVRKYANHRKKNAIAPPRIMRRSFSARAVRHVI